MTRPRVAARCLTDGAVMASAEHAPGVGCQRLVVQTSNASSSALLSVPCASKTDCTAGGWYDDSTSGEELPLSQQYSRIARWTKPGKNKQGINHRNW